MPQQNAAAKEGGMLYGFSISTVCSTGLAALTQGSMPRPNCQATTFTSMGNVARAGNWAIFSVPFSMTAGPWAM